MATKIKLNQLAQSGATDGQVATWDNTLQTWKAATSSGGGSSSGIAGAIQFSGGSGVFSSDATNFFFDDTANQLQLNGGTSYGILINGQNGGVHVSPSSSITGALNGFRVAGDATGSINIAATNTNTSSSSAAARVVLTTSAGGGDPYMLFNTAEVGYSIGVDNDGSDKFYIGLGTSPSGMSTANITLDAAKMGVMQTTPTAKLHISGGTAAANTAPLKIDSGTAMTTPEDGAIEYHGSHLYFTIGSTRYQLDQQGGGVTIATNQVAYATGTNTLGGNANFIFNGTDVGIGGNNVSTFRLNVYGATKSDGTLVSKGAGNSFNADLASSHLRLWNTTLSTGDTWYIGSRNDGGLDIQSGNLSQVIRVDATTGLFTHSYSFALSGAIAPAQLTSDQNNYAPAGLDAASVVRISSDSSMRTITGIANTAPGKIIEFRNVGSFPIIFAAGHTGSTAANRIEGTSDIILYPKGQISFQYDNTDSLWYVRSVVNPFNYSKRFFHNALPGLATAGDHPYLVWLASGTGAAVAAVASTTALPQSFSLATGTTATGANGIGLYEGGTTSVSLGGSYIRTSATVSVNTLSTGTETYTYVFRLASSPTLSTVASNNTIGIRYTNGVNSGKWECFTRNNAGTETTVDSGITVAVDTLYNLEIVANKAGTEIRYYIDGAFVGLITTNIPTARAITPNICMTKSVGTTSITGRFYQITCESLY